MTSVFDTRNKTSWIPTILLSQISKCIYMDVITLFLIQWLYFFRNSFLYSVHFCLTTINYNWLFFLDIIILYINIYNISKVLFLKLLTTMKRPFSLITHCCLRKRLLSLWKPSHLLSQHFYLFITLLPPFLLHLPFLLILCHLSPPLSFLLICLHSVCASRKFLLHL